MHNKNSIISQESQKYSTYLLVRFITDAPRTQKSRYFVHREKSYTFRWSISYFSLPSLHQVQDCVIQVAFLDPTQQSLLNYRKHFGCDVSEYARDWSYRNDRSSQTQRSVSISCWSSCISGSNYSTTILATPFTRWSNEASLCTFTIFKDDVTEASSSQEHDSRYGLHRSDSLWKTGACSCWIQSDQTWTSVISSALMLRWHHQRLYSWRTPSRQRVYISRNDQLTRRILCQNTTNRKTCFYPRRQRVLRSQDCRKNRNRAFAHVCHRRKINCSYQETAFISSVSQPNTGDRNSRISPINQTDGNIAIGL